MTVLEVGVVIINTQEHFLHKANDTDTVDPFIFVSILFRKRKVFVQINTHKNVYSN